MKMDDAFKLSLNFFFLYSAILFVELIKRIHNLKLTIKKMLLCRNNALAATIFVKLTKALHICRVLVRMSGKLHMYTVLATLSRLLVY